MADKTIFVDNITWDGQEADEIFAKPIFTDPDLLNLVRIIPNIKSKKQLAVDSMLEKILKKVTTCARNPSGNLITLSDRFLEVENVGVDLEQCALSLEDGFLEQFLNSGNKIFDLDGTYLKTYIEAKVVDALKMDVPRVLFFGDKASADPNYNQFDGFWKSLLALGATNPTMVAPAIPATLPDAGETNANGINIGAKKVLDIFRSIYNAQPQVLKALPANRKRFIVNIELAEALQDAYNAGGSVNGDIFIRRNQDGEGLDVFKFKGIDVIGMAHWTNIIETDLGGDNVYRAILTDTQNLVVGTDRIEDVMNVEFMYHPYPRVNTLEANFKLGTQVLWPELTVYALSPAVV